MRIATASAWSDAGKTIKATTATESLARITSHCGQHIRPGASNGDVTIVLPITTDCADNGAVCRRRGTIKVKVAFTDDAQNRNWNQCPIAFRRTASIHSDRLWASENLEGFS